MRRYTALIVALLLAGSARGEGDNPAPHINLVHSYADSIGWAAADILQRSEFSRQFTRYIYLPAHFDYADGQVDLDRSKSTRAALELVINWTINHLNVPVRALPYDQDNPDIHAITEIANGWMWAVNFAQIVPDPAMLQQILSIWDEDMAVQDSSYHIYDSETASKDRVVVAHAAIGQPELLEQLLLHTQSLAPIYDAEFFVYKALSNIEGGVYYSLVLPKSVTAPETKNQQVAALAIFGANESLSKSLGGVQSAGLISRVTGKPRRIDGFTGIGSNTSGSFVAITHDISDESLSESAAKSYSLNLLAFVDDAREIFVERANGSLLMMLTTNTGKLLDEAPQNVVSDSLVPLAWSKRLQGAISCIRCHVEGYRPVADEVALMFSGRANILDDLRASNNSLAANQLAARYARALDGAEPENDLPLGRARRDLGVAVRAMCGLSTTEAFEAVAGLYDSYRYAYVDARRAAADLGAIVTSGSAEAAFDDLVPAASPEHIYIIRLKAGFPLARAEWEKIKLDAYTRKESRDENRNFNPDGGDASTAGSGM